MQVLTVLKDHLSLLSVFLHFGLGRHGLMPESLMLRDKTGMVHEVKLKETPTGKQ